MGGNGMSAVLAAPTIAQRSGLFGIVAGAHLVLLTMLTLARVEVPPIEAHTIAVELLPMAAGGPVAQAQPKAATPAVAPLAPRTVPQRSRPVSKPAVKAPAVKVPAATEAEPPPELTASTVPSEQAIAPPSFVPSSSVAGAVSAPVASGGNAASAGASGGGAFTAPSGSGDGTSQARFDADYLRNPAPPYPSISRRMREEGKVTLRVLVAPQGTAESIEVKTSSGSTWLDEAALRTVRQWKFIPARRGDAAIQSWVLVPVILKL